MLHTPQSQTRLLDKTIYQVSSVAEVDLRRRSQVLRLMILSIVCLLVPYLLFSIAFTPGSVPISALLGDSVDLVVLGCAYWLNRVMTPIRVALAAYLTLVFFDLAAAAGIFFSEPMLHTYALVFTSFFLVATLAAGIVISPSAPGWFAALGSLLTLGILLLAHHADDLTTVIQQQGLASIIGPLIGLQILIALLTWIGMRSLRQAYHAIDRAAELQAAYDNLARQKTELEADIQNLQQAYAAGANGDLSVRVHLEGRLLWPLAQSLNLLFDRLGRLSLQLQRLSRLEQTVNELIQTLERRQRKQPWGWPPAQGTAVDRLIALLETSS